jgi:hypothetical protein
LREDPEAGLNGHSYLLQSDKAELRIGVEFDANGLADEIMSKAPNLVVGRALDERRRLMLKA